MSSLPGFSALALTALASTALALAASPASATSPLDLPAAIEFGASPAALGDSFDQLCESYQVRQLDPAELPIAQDSHTQVDCHGFDHAGRGRLAEFVFADDSLAFIWILTDASEEGTHLAALRAQYGSPSHDTPVFVAFADHNVALRRDVPEFLYYGEAIAPMYRGWFDQMAAQ